MENFKNNTSKRNRLLVHGRIEKSHRQPKLISLEATQKTRSKLTYTKAVLNAVAVLKKSQGFKDWNPRIQQGLEIIPYREPPIRPPEGKGHSSLSISKVVTDLRSYHKSLQLCAVHALAKYLQIPQNVPEVLSNTEVVELAVNLYMKIKEDPLMYGKEIEPMLNIFYYLSTHSEGAEKLMHHKGLLHYWYTAILQRDINMELISKILRNLTLNRKVIAYLVEHSNALTDLSAIFDRYSSQPYPDALWLHLSHLLKSYPKRGVQKQFFEILFDCVIKNPECCHERVYKCFGHMLRAKESLPFFRKIEGLQWLYTILCEDASTNYEYIVYALMQALHHKGMTRRCYRLSHLPDLLIFLAEDTQNERLQLYCLKSLRLLCREVAIKAHLRTMKYSSLIAIRCLNTNNQWARNNLCSWLKADRSERMMRALLEIAVNEGCEAKSVDSNNASDLSPASTSYPSWSDSDSNA